MIRTGLTLALYAASGVMGDTADDNVGTQAQHEAF